MASYVVMEPPGGGTARAELVRDRFTFLGFFFPPLWLLWHRLWIEAFVAAAILLLIGGLGGLIGSGPVSAVLSLLLSLYVGLEGPALRLNALRRRGWREAGVIEAGGPDDADMVLLFDEERPAAPTTPFPAGSAVPMRTVRKGPSLDLLGHTGR